MFHSILRSIIPPSPRDSFTRVDITTVVRCFISLFVLPKDWSSRLIKGNKLKICRSEGWECLENQQEEREHLFLHFAACCTTEVTHH
jgi:hypothetical protein